MIYLIFDSDIWLNSLKESGEEDNFIDSLEYWIENGNVTILLPENIITEWGRNRDTKKKVLITDWKAFFNRAKKVFAPETVSQLMTPEYLDEMVEKQLKRVETIFENYAIKIPITNGIKLKAAEMAEQKKAPFGPKNSIGDAYIYLSITDYIDSNGLSNCVFITNNHTDFSLSDKEKHKIHTDLEPEFIRLQITYYVDLRRFFYEYSAQLPDTTEYKKLKALKEEDKKLSSAVLNPETLENLTGLRDSYIENVNHLELILKTKSPTKEQVIFALGLIDSDESYREYFFKKVEGPVWFKILKEKGIFNPSNNPSPIQVKDGFQMPYWEPLAYLEKLSDSIKIGNDLSLVDDILEIITAVSERPSENYRTWYTFIKILINLPNEKISLDILNFIPVWFGGKFDTMLQSSEVCDKLLPKFLSASPTNEDIEKAELILKYLFSVEEVENAQDKDTFGMRDFYRSRVYLHFLSKVLVEDKFATNIAAYCSDSVIINLANTVKKLRFTFPKGINIEIKVNQIEYALKAELADTDLHITLFEKNDLEKTIGKKTIIGIENLNSKQTKDGVIAILKELGIEYEENNENAHNFDFLIYTLENGSSYYFSDDRISKLDEEHYYREDIEIIFSLVLRDLLIERLRQKPKEGKVLVKMFALSTQYRLTFFRRLALYVICENWESCKEIFWEMVDDSDPKHLFSSSSFHNELYELLDKNKALFNEHEIAMLQKIIDLGQQDKAITDDGSQDYWKQRWYSALRGISPFSEKYDKIVEEKGITKESYEAGDSILKSGTVPPFSLEEILKKSNSEIASFINDFKPKDRWEEPNIDGLSEILGQAIEAEPQKFADEIMNYRDVYYIYAYRMANGFREAWKNKKTFNWENVLVFFKEYITNEKFISGQYQIEKDGWGATADWVTGAIGNLLTQGMQSDSNAFDLSLLPIVKEILEILVSRLERVDDFKQTNMDYPTYSLNSTAGKVLRTLLDYSLRRGRNIDENMPKWEEDVKMIFETSLHKGIIDGYILTGWYFQQFCFLDKDWIFNKIKEYHNLKDKEWLAFISGFAYSNPPRNKEVYELFYPHYEKAITQNVKIESRNSHGIIRHIATFFFWDLEDLEKDGLLLKLIHKNDIERIVELVNFIWRQEDNINSAKDSDKEKLREKILSLWSFLAYRYSDSDIEGNTTSVLEALLHLVVFVPVLNNANTELILKSFTATTGQYFYAHSLLKNLYRLKDEGDPIETARNLGVILNTIQFAPYLSSNDTQHVSDLIIFLYEHGQREIAEEFCNKMAKLGHEFLIEIHNKHK